MQFKKHKIIEVIPVILLSVSLISAFNFDYFSPEDLFENEWALFTLVVALLFLCIYTFIENRMHNSPVSAVISAGLSLLMSIPITKRGLLEGFLDESMIDKILIASLIIFGLFLIYRFGTKKTPGGKRKISFRRILIILLLIVLILPFIKAYLPKDLLYGYTGEVISLTENLSQIAILVIGIIIFVLWLLGRMWKRREKKLEWRAKRKGELEAQRRRRKWRRRDEISRQRQPKRSWFGGRQTEQQRYKRLKEARKAYRKKAKKEESRRDKAREIAKEQKKAQGYIQKIKQRQKDKAEKQAYEEKIRREKEEAKEREKAEKLKNKQLARMQNQLNEQRWKEEQEKKAAQQKAIEKSMRRQKEKQAREEAARRKAEERRKKEFKEIPQERALVKVEKQQTALAKIQKKEIIRKQRTLEQLQSEFDAHSNEAARIFEKYKRIPSKKSDNSEEIKDAKRRSRLNRAMNLIRKEAIKLGGKIKEGNNR